MGWGSPVGVTRVSKPEQRQASDFLYSRIEFLDVRLSQVAVLMLLQGMSIRQLFTDVLAPVPGGHTFYSLVHAETPCLWRPPVSVPRVVLAHMLSMPEKSRGNEDIYRELAMAEIVS